jgi:hypothetical protein
MLLSYLQQNQGVQSSIVSFSGQAEGAIAIQKGEEKKKKSKSKLADICSNPSNDVDKQLCDVICANESLDVCMCLGCPSPVLRLGLVAV